jgi:DNA polymerase-3 subunit gamma/tau
MSEVLYRKYRSQNFDDLVGQEHITKLLKNAVKSNSISHAYLFVGSRGTGKTSTARILAKALNCDNLQDDGNPCNECERCKSITLGTFLDLIEIDAASNRGIDQIRELKEKIEFSPNEGDYKIYIIDEVHMLTTEAFNALLKTLEEPPEHVVFILATTDVHKLPATILSRCQRYDFRLGGNEEIRKLIDEVAERENIKISKGAKELLVENAHGSYRDALSLLDVVVSGQLGSEDPDEVSEEEVRQILGIPDSTMVYYLLENIVNKDTDKALELIDELEVRGVDMQQFVKYVLNTLRELLVHRMSEKSSKDSEFGFADQLNRREILRVIKLFLDAERNLRNAQIPGLILEMAVAEATIGETSGKSDSVNSENGLKPKGDGEKDTKVNKQTKKVMSKDAKETDNKVVNKSKGIKNKNTDIEITDSKASKKDDAKPKLEGKLTVKAIEERWDDITKMVQEFNSHLYAFIKASKILEVKGEELRLEVPFKFHKDRIEDPKSREFLLKILNDIYGVEMRYTCVVNESAQTKKPVAADVVLKKIQSNSPEEGNKKEKVENKKGQSSNNQANVEAKQVKQSKKVNPKIEAIFAGM